MTNCPPKSRVSLDNTDTFLVYRLPRHIGKTSGYRLRKSSNIQYRHAGPINNPTLLVASYCTPWKVRHLHLLEIGPVHGPPMGLGTRRENSPPMMTDSGCLTTFLAPRTFLGEGLIINTKLLLYLEGRSPASVFFPKAPRRQRNLPHKNLPIVFQPA